MIPASPFCSSVRGIRFPVLKSKGAGMVRSKRKGSSPECAAPDGNPGRKGMSPAHGDRRTRRRRPVRAWRAPGRDDLRAGEHPVGIDRRPGQRRRRMTRAGVAGLDLRGPAAERLGQKLRVSFVGDRLAGELEPRGQSSPLVPGVSREDRHHGEVTFAQRLRRVARKHGTSISGPSKVLGMGQDCGGGQLAKALEDVSSALGSREAQLLSQGSSRGFDVLQRAPERAVRLPGWLRCAASSSWSPRFAGSPCGTGPPTRGT